MQLQRILCLLILSILLQLPSRGQGFLRTEGERIVNEKGQNILLRGVGLGGWMLQEGYMLRLSGAGQQQYMIREKIEKLLSKEQTQDFYDLWLANHTRKIDIDSMKAWGFNSVRLPMHYNLYTLPIEKEPVAGQQTWIEKGFAMTDSLLAWCKANKMYLILDLHAAPGGQGNDLNISDRNPNLPSLWESEANQQKMIAFWKKIAQRYANEPYIGAYDIINEPNWGFEDSLDKNGQKEKSNVPLRKLMVDITKAIREVDTKHIIIIEGNGWGNNYNGILPVWDKNMVLSFHKYWNSNDLKSIQHILNFRSQHKVPVWLGETGENTNTWFTEAIRLFEEKNIGWAWWPLKKVGSNNPLEIRSNHNYDHLVEYWNGKREKPPKESDVYSGLIELATYARFEANFIHRDVIDAMIRQPFDRTARAFKPNKIGNTASISATDYDLGVNGYAYYDNDTVNYRLSRKDGNVGNRGHVYRNDGIDIYKDSSHYEVYYISDTEVGEWMQYTVDAVAAGTYDITFWVSSTNDEGVMGFHSTQSDKLSAIDIPNTGGAKKWKAVELKDFKLTKGRQQLRIFIQRGGFNIRNMEFKKKV